MACILSLTCRCFSALSEIPAAVRRDERIDSISSNFWGFDAPDASIFKALASTMKGVAFLFFSKASATNPARVSSYGVIKSLLDFNKP